MDFLEKIVCLYRYCMNVQFLESFDILYEIKLLLLMQTKGDTEVTDINSPISVAN